MNSDATRALELLASDPNRWLWDYHIQVELLRLLRKLGRVLGEAERQALADLIAAGPPREMYREDLEPGEWEDMRDRMIAKRLARLGQEAIEDKEDFPYRSESTFGHDSDSSAEELLALNDEELWQVLTENSRYRAGRLEDWRQASVLNPERVIAACQVFLERKQFDSDVWSSALLGLRKAGEEPSMKEPLLDFVERLPSEHLGSVIRRVTVILENVITRSIADSLRDRALAMWDRAMPVAAMVPTSYTGTDQLTAAINHPIGDLAGALFNVLRSYPSELGKGMAKEIRTRLERLLDITNASKVYARVVIASRLSWLHFLSPEWTEKRLVPLFDWASPGEASGMWQGYLWSPTLPPSLWAVMKPSFLATFHHLEEIGDHNRLFVHLFVAVAIQIPGALTHDEARESLRQLGESERTEIAHWLVMRLKDAKERAAVLWRERIGPWLESAWPKEPALRGSRVSVPLAQAAILSGVAFQEAVTSVAPLLVPIEHGHLIVDKTVEVGHTELHPEASLELINALVADTPALGLGNLSDFLDRIQTVAPLLGADQRFRRLKAISISHNI